MTSETDPALELLRHTLATLAYRGAKAMRDVSDDFSTFRASERTRTPLEILGHMGDLIEWALSQVRGGSVEAGRAAGMVARSEPLLRRAGRA